jgi:hypothetical protein
LSRSGPRGVAAHWGCRCDARAVTAELPGVDEKDIEVSLARTIGTALSSEW